MSVQVENLEHNMAKLTIELGADELERAIQNAYQRQKSRISIPGFRKGKVPRKMIEKMYGEGIFYEDAANQLMQDNYPSAIDESGLDIVSRPTIDVVQIESGKPFIFTAEVAVKPDVMLGEYKGIEVTAVDTEVTDAEVEDALEEERNNNARNVTVTDRPAEMGDTVVIDFEGFVDGVAFEGGRGENHSLELGSHSFIDTFEDQLVGKNSGDDVEVHVTFPEQYQAQELAGKPALFKVKINEIRTKELPDLDDDFAQDVSEFDTLDEYKEDLKKSLAENKKTEAHKTQEDEALAKVIENSEMDIPEAMIDTQCDTMMDEFAQRLAQSGIGMQQYMQFSGMTVDKLKEQFHPEALSRIQGSLVLEKIVDVESIEASEDDLENKIQEIAAGYGLPAENLKENMDDTTRDPLKREVCMSKALDLIMDNVKEVQASETDNSEE